MGADTRVATLDQRGQGRGARLSAPGRRTPPAMAARASGRRAGPFVPAGLRPGRVPAAGGIGLPPRRRLRPRGPRHRLPPARRGSPPAPPRLRRADRWPGGPPLVRLHRSPLPPARPAAGPGVPARPPAPPRRPALLRPDHRAQRRAADDRRAPGRYPGPLRPRAPGQPLHQSGRARDAGRRGAGRGSAELGPDPGLTGRSAAPDGADDFAVPGRPWMSLCAVVPSPGAIHS